MRFDTYWFLFVIFFVLGIAAVFYNIDVIANQTDVPILEFSERAILKTSSRGSVMDI